MMNTKNIKTIKERVVPILKQQGVRRAGLFGSTARGEMSDTSDVDILVELDKDKSLLDFIHLQHELEDALGRKVDLVEYASIKPMIRDQILREQQPIL